MSAFGTRLVAFGECMVELRRQSGPVMIQSFGGDTLNSAVYLARVSDGKYIVSYATALGDSDSFSQAMIDSWTEEGISTRFVTRLKGQVPGLYTIDVDPTGERRFAYWRDTSAAKQYFDGPSSPLETDFDAYDVFYFSGISLAILSDLARETLFGLMERMRQSGKTIIFDNNYRARLWKSPEAAEMAYARAFHLADVALITLSDEMERHEEGVEEAELRRVLNLTVPELVIKRGAAPALVRDHDQQLTEIATMKVDRVVDTTAAGDSFGAGYIAARMRGYSPVEAAGFGNRLAAVVIQHPGAIIPLDAMPKLFA